MPHKHKRKRGPGDDADYNLPPTQTARPLSVFPKSNIKNGTKNGAKNGAKSGAQPVPKGVEKKPKKNKKSDDDAPRAFKRLMAVAQGKKFRSGLDDGTGDKGARKDTASAMPKILPGENMRDFTARVNAELPLAGLTKKTVVKDGKDEAGLKIYRTRKERKMHKLYDQWRAEEQKIQDSREEASDLAEQQALDDEMAGIPSAASMFENIEGTGKKKSKKRRGQDDDEDPWLELKRKRAEAKVGLHDTAQAPPELHKQITRQLKVEGAMVEVGSVPKAAGSLRRREELHGVRQDVVDAYRKIREHEQAKLSGSSK